jgi:hypothetical protein
VSSVANDDGAAVGENVSSVGTNVAVGNNVPVGVSVAVGIDVSIVVCDVGVNVAVGNDVPIVANNDGASDVACDDGGSVPVGVNVIEGESVCCVAPPSSVGVSDGVFDAPIVGANVSEGDGVVATVGTAVTCRALTQLSGTTKSSVPMSVKLPPSNSNTVDRGEFISLVSRTSILTRPPAKPFPLASSIVTL